MITFLVTHDDNGGTQILWEKIAAEIRDRGESTSLLAIYNYEKAATPAWDAAARNGLTPTNLLPVAVRIMRWIRARKPRAIVSALPLANVINAIVGPISGVRTRIVSHHSPVDTYHPLLRRLDRFLGSTPCVTRVVCVSQGVRQSLSGYPKAYLEKTVVVRNALSGEIKSKIASLQRDRNQPLAGRPARLVAMGRLSAQKNYPTLIKAMAKVENAVLEICGDGPDRGDLEALRNQLGLEQRIVFHGHIEHDEALAIAAKADVFLQPSLFEGHSIALLEAAELSLPLIVSDAPTQVEAVMLPDRTLAGVVVPVFDADALAEAINGTISQVGRLAELSGAAKQLASGTTFSDLVSNYLRLADA